MITLKRDNIVMEVATELQASVFLRSGYVRVDKEKLMAEATKADPVKEADPVPEKPKRRSRRKAES